MTIPHNPQPDKENTAKMAALHMGSRRPGG